MLAKSDFWGCRVGNKISPEVSAFYPANCPLVPPILRTFPSSQNPRIASTKPPKRKAMWQNLKAKFWGHLNLLCGLFPCTSHNTGIFQGLLFVIFSSLFTVSHLNHSHDLVNWVSLRILKGNRWYTQIRANHKGLSKKKLFTKNIYRTWGNFIW